MLDDTGSLVQSLQERAVAQPEHLALRFISDAAASETLTFRQLELRARAMAVLLQERTVPGDRVVLLLPSGLDYVASFYGCLMAGLIAVPAFPPESMHPQHLERLRVIIDDSEPSLILAEPAVCETIGTSFGARASLLPVSAPLPGMEERWRHTSARPEDIAFLQYTSGSTAAPKGVQVTHGNLVANERLIHHALGLSAEDTMVSWLPLYHDMGLISGLLLPIFSGFTCVLMSPEYFLERPVRWLQAINRYRGTVSGAPDFGYRLCAERIPGSALADLDLGSWKVAYCGAEPIRPATLDAFAAKFKPAGFSDRSFLGCYGLAEATLLAFCGGRQQGILTQACDVAALAEHRLVPGEGPALASSGGQLPGHDVSVVDGATATPLPPGEVGEIWVSGPSITSGYWRKPEATASTFVEVDGRVWLRTGDLGAMHGGQIYVTGRLKDMLIIRGQNIYPQDLERAVEDQVQLVRRARVAAFSVQRDGVEAIGIAAEIGRGTRKKLAQDELVRAIRTAVFSMCGEAPAVVALLNPGALPKTSSGKLQRSACRAKLENGSLDSYLVQDGPDQASNSYAAPVGPAELAVAAVWEDVLGIAPVGRDADFFALGGDSVVSIQVVSRLAQRGWQVTPRQLFEQPTVRALAALAERVVARTAYQPATGPLVVLGGEERRALPVPSAEIEDLYPLAPMQEGLLLHTLLEPGSGIYLMQNRHRIDGPIDLDLFDRAWELVVARNEALRTCFVWDGVERPLQIVRRRLDGYLLHHDWRDLDAAEQELRLEAELQDELDRGMDMAQGPLFRVRLMRLADERFDMVVSYHHTIMDAWCVFLLLSDFVVFYRALESGREPLVVPAPPYRDFIAWLLQREPEPTRAYWRDALRGVEAATPLPADRLPGVRQGHSRIIDRQLTLDPAADRALRELAGRHRLTVNTFVQAAWALTLRQHGGGPEILFGITVAGRPLELPELQGTLGLFINSIPLRIHVPGGADATTVQAWLEGLLEQNLAMREHEHLPLVEIQALSGLPQGTALFDSLFVFENAPIDLTVVEGAEALRASVTGSRTHTNYPITAVAYPHGVLGLHLSCDGRFFEPATVERLLATFHRALVALVQGFASPVRDLDLLDPAERTRLVETVNATERAYPLDGGYGPLFRAVAARHGDRVAASCAGTTLTYAALARQANRTAHALIAAGMRPDDSVALLDQRGLGFLVAAVGTLQAGAGYLGLDPAHPPKRLGRILADARPRVVVTSAACRPLLDLALATIPAAAHPPVLLLDDLARRDLPEHLPRVAAGPRHLAYVIYTSGSTGMPKGVMVEQEGMLNNQLSKVPQLGLTADDVIAQTAGQGFDISVWQLLAGLLCGARIEIVPDAIAHDPAALLQHVRASGITVLECVPSLIQGMLDAEPVALPRLRWLLPTGEALPPALAASWLQRYPHVPLVNAYGPAECSDDVACHRLDQPPGEMAFVPIGTPTDNNRLYVLDDALQPLPAGAVGELAVAGTGVGRGYLGDPGRTAERFVPDPFSDAGGRLYRTGDLARWNRDGLLECVGRSDQQVKVRGFRIELGEIEAQLRRHAELRDAAVTVQDGPLGRQLVGYVVPADPAAADLPQQLKEHLKQQLPDYMVPARLVALDQLPRTANGKLDRNALPEIAAAPRTHVPPQTDLEQQLARIWQQVLKIDTVGRYDNFLELGGHSLLTTQVFARVRKELQVSISLRDVFEASTIEELAALIERGQRSTITTEKASRLNDLMAQLEAM